MDGDREIVRITAADVGVLRLGNKPESSKDRETKVEKLIADVLTGSQQFAEVHPAAKVHGQTSIVVILADGAAYRVDAFELNPPREPVTHELDVNGSVSLDSETGV